MGREDRHHAVVMGAGIGGLTTAAVLARHYRHVTVLDKDELPNDGVWRSGVPQGRHVHVLQAKGRNVLEQLLPGFTAQMAADGCLVGDEGTAFRLYFEGGRFAATETGLIGIGATRPHLEAGVRRAVTAAPNVEIFGRCHVDGLTHTPDASRVTGLVLLRDGRSETVAADLVVDATGRTSRSPAWLGAMGYETAPVERVEPHLGYATRMYERHPGQFDGIQGVVSGATPKVPRGAVLWAVEGDRWMLTLAAGFEDKPPTDPAGFEAFAKQVVAPEPGELVSTCRPLDDPVPFRFPASVRRRYERVPQHPEGYLVVADALCSFNPVYGQGMSVAATEAETLDRLLREGRRNLARRFYKKAARIIDGPWDVAVGGDYRDPRVEGDRTAKVRLVNAYVSKLQLAAQRDPVLTDAFVKVLSLVEPPTSILRPSIAWRVMRGTRQVERETKAATSARRATPSLANAADR